MVEQDKKVLKMDTKHLDGWENEITGLGVYGTDKRVSGQIAAPLILARSALDDLLRGDFLARKISYLPPREMTREGIEIIPTEIITPEKIEKINEDTEALKLWKSIRRGLQWSRLYGGGVAVMIIDDGGEPWEPVNLKAIKSIKGVYDLDRHQIYPIRWQDDTEQPGFGDPVIYQLTPTVTVPISRSTQVVSEAAMKSVMTEFHRSRLMVFDGIDLPQHIRLQNDGWGDSVLQAIYNELRNYHSGQDGAATLVASFAQAVFKIKNLHSKVAAGSGSVVSTRMSLINLGLSMINAAVIDADGEDFERQSTPVSGLPELLDRFERAVIAASEIPHTVLFGDSPSGLGASGVSEEKTWKDSIKGMQEDRIRPELDLFFKYYSASTESKLNGEKITYEFKSLWQMSDKEKAEIRKIISEADKNNIQFNVYGEDEARTRYEGGDFSLDISLDEEGRREMQTAEEEVIEE